MRGTFFPFLGKVCLAAIILLFKGIYGENGDVEEEMFIGSHVTNSPAFLFVFHGGLIVACQNVPKCFLPCIIYLLIAGL